jgi:nitrite reductase/ring-hydroxylating ferredoxin subunit
MPDPEEPLLLREGDVAVCASERLADGSIGVRFAVQTRSARSTRPASGFVVRFLGTVYGYLNQCAHVPTELDWQEGQFFDHSGLYLMCATHGAVYEPESGRCVGGPCRGGRLLPLQILECQGMVYWRPDDAFFPPDPVLIPTHARKQ